MLLFTSDGLGLGLVSSGLGLSLGLCLNNLILITSLVAGSVKSMLADRTYNIPCADMSTMAQWTPGKRQCIAGPAAVPILRAVQPCKQTPFQFSPIINTHTSERRSVRKGRGGGKIIAEE